MQLKDGFRKQIINYEHYYISKKQKWTANKGTKTTQKCTGRQLAEMCFKTPGYVLITLRFSVKVFSLRAGNITNKGNFKILLCAAYSLYLSLTFLITFLCARAEER
jgi:hypothetical protein